MKPFPILTKRTLNLGLIGVGRWGSNFVKTIKNIKNLNLICVTSFNQEIKSSLISKCKLEKEWKKLILTKDLDGVIVCTPPSTHYEILKECIKLKIPVLIEKPFVLSVKEAEEIKTLAEVNSSLVLVDYIHLHHPSFLKLCDLVENHKQILKVHSFSGNNGPFRKDVRALWDWIPHDIAMCMKLFNQIPKVSNAYYLKRDFSKTIPGELLKIELLFESGVNAYITVGNLMEKKSKKFVVEFVDHKLVYQPHSETSLIKVVEDQIFHSFSYNDEQPMFNLINKFSKYIKNRSICFKDINLSFEITKIIEEIEHKLES